MVYRLANDWGIVLLQRRPSYKFLILQTYYHNKCWQCAFSASLQTTDMLQLFSLDEHFRYHRVTMPCLRFWWGFSLKCFGLHKHRWRCTTVSFKISSGVWLANVETQSGTVVTGLADFSPVTPLQSPPPSIYYFFSFLKMFPVKIKCRNYHPSKLSITLQTHIIKIITKQLVGISVYFLMN